jgi:DNA ligase-3
MAENRFAVDYAKLGTSACKKCKAKITKGEIRIAKITPSPFSDGGTMKIYHHVPCIFDTFLQARITTKIIESSTDLDGWSNISPADRDIIMERIEEVEAARANKTTEKSPTKKATKPVPAVLPKQATITPTKKSLPPPPPVTISIDDDDEKTIDNDEIEIIDDKEEDVKQTVTDGVHSSTNDDPKHPDNSFRQFRGLCTKIAEVNGHLAKTSIVEQFITQGTDGESYKGKNTNIFSIISIFDLSTYQN